MTDTGEAMAEAMATATPVPAAETEPIASQATRGRARAREAQRTTPPGAHSDDARRLNLAGVRGQLAEFAGKQAFMQSAPATPTELWRRVRMTACETDAALLKAVLYIGGGLGYLITAVTLAAACLLTLGFGGGGIKPLRDLQQIASDAIDRQTNPWAARVLRVGYGLCGLGIAACYGVAYLVQFPLLVTLLGVCMGIAYLTILF